MIISVIVLVVSAVFFALGKIRSDIVALCALLTLIITGVLTPQEALAGFSNPVIIMMVGLFVVGGGILQTGLAKIISQKIMKLCGTNSLALFLMVMIVTSFIGAFVSNTGTVALMLPIVVSMAASANKSPRTLLMPLAFASSMGGMLTLIGTPPNLVIQEALTDAGFTPLSFFSFAPVGFICIIVGILVLLPLSKWLLSDKGINNNGKKHGKSLAELVSEYRLSENLYLVSIPNASPIIGKNIAELDLYNRYGITVLEVRQETGVHGKLIKNITQKTAGSDTTFYADDIIYISGREESINQFSSDYNLSVQNSRTGNKANENKLEFFDIGIAELVLLPQSRLIDRLLRYTALRAKYNINVVAIRRKGEYIRDNLANEKLTSGDVLLVQGAWSNIERLDEEEEDWVVLGQPLAEAQKVTLSYRAPVAAFIMMLMIAMMVFDFIPVAPVTAVMLAGILMVLSGCFRNVEAAYKTINWESIVLIAAMMPMSVALEKTGASSLLSHTLVNSLGSAGPVILLAGIYFTTSLLTMFISNTATAVLMAPIALQSATELGVSPYAFLFSVTLGASMCFASPFATPPNALVMQAGRYTFMDYIKVGLPLQIIMGIVMVLVLPLIFPF